MAFPIEFTMPPGWRAPQPHEADCPLGAVLAVRQEGVATIAAESGIRLDNAPLADIADETIAALRACGAGVEVLSRTEVGTEESPGFTQVLRVHGETETVQCQAFLAMLDVEDSAKRAVLRLAMTTTADQVAALVGDFQQVLGTVRPPATTEDYGTQQQPEQPKPRHTQSHGDLSNQ